MFLRTRARHFTINKGPQTPGPTLAGWGRTAQKRRLEYETVESKYGKREFNKNWDLAGTEIRTTDYMQMRVWAGYSGRIGTWFYNMAEWYFLCVVPGMCLLVLFYQQLISYGERVKRQAWW
ncbi:hypothetical protein XU18_3256 [Perkinsela sp. CCAP 1560/4]|nr:hypothetical protein XU18_3256 [Perkinsela sp. CCAP 1560/4]|eukprot:KNH05734.1 hypothetical protein XU18_3256 [Perkinsela sp. CCAP 1560/4]